MSVFGFGTDTKTKELEQARKTNDWNQEMEQIAMREREYIEYQMAAVFDFRTGKEYTEITEMETGASIRSDVLIDCEDAR